MKRFKFYWRIAFIVAGIAAITGCALSPSQTVNRPKQLQPQQIIVTLSEDQRKHWLAIDYELRKKYHLQWTGEFPLTSIRVNCLVYRVPDTQAVADVVRQLRTDPRVQLVQANQVFAGLQAGESDAYAGLSYGPKSIHADAAHHIATGKGVSITIIDTGADKNHPDLKGRVGQSRNFVEGGDASFAQDRHGTAVTGIIAARANDGIGIYGIAPEADITVYKACWYEQNGDDKALCSSWTLAKALDAAINAGSRVINLSLNGPADTLLQELLATAKQRNIVTFAAATGGDGAGFPASLDTVVPVLASDSDGQAVLPTWAVARQPLLAPGIEILTTTPRDGYDFLSGSSLATAHASGAAALLLQYQPQLKPEQIKAVLHRTSQSQSSNGAKVIDACQALLALGASITCP